MRTPAVCTLVGPEQTMPASGTARKWLLHHYGVVTGNEVRPDLQVQEMVYCFSDSS